MATVEAQIYYPKHTSIWQNVASVTGSIILISTTVARSLQLVRPGLIMIAMQSNVWAANKHCITRMAF